MEKNLLGGFSLQKKETDRGSKTTTTKTETAVVNSCTQNTLESKTDVALTVYTCQTKSMVHYK